MRRNKFEQFESVVCKIVSIVSDNEDDREYLKEYIMQDKFFETLIVLKYLECYHEWWITHFIKWGYESYLNCYDFPTFGDKLYSLVATIAYGYQDIVFYDRFKIPAFEKEFEEYKNNYLNRLIFYHAFWEVDKVIEKNMYRNV